MRRRLESVEPASLRKNKRASVKIEATRARRWAQPAAPAAVPPEAAVDIVDSRNNHRVHARLRRETPGHLERHVFRLDLLPVTADPHFVTGSTLDVPDEPEDFQRRGKIAREPRRRAPPPRWRCGQAGTPPRLGSNLADLSFSHGPDCPIFLRIESKESFSMLQCNSTSLPCRGLFRPGSAQRRRIRSRHVPSCHNAARRKFNAIFAVSAYRRLT